MPYAELPAKATYVYEIDEDDRITFVSDAWAAFAKRYGAGQFANRDVIGESLWTFITNPDTCALYQYAVYYVPSREETIRLPFRCDTPGVRRWMQLVVEPRPNSAVRFTSRLISQERRQSQRLLDPNARRNDDKLTMCGICFRFRLPDNSWREVEEAVGAYHLETADQFPALTHALCGTCYDLVKSKLE